MEGRLSWYFAYGSNMDAGRLFSDRLAPEGVAAGLRIAGRLDGWRLVFDKRARHPAGAGAGNIVVDPQGIVHGTLNLLPAAGLVVLDRYEGVADGHYERRVVRVQRGDGEGEVDAITYVALKTAGGLRPTRAYLAYLLAGQDLLPPDYVRWLAATPTLD